MSISQPNEIETVQLVEGERFNAKGMEGDEFEGPIVPSAILRSKLLTDALKLTLAVLRDYGGQIFPSYKTIAERRGINRDTARRHVWRLTELGFLEVDIHGHGRTNLFHFIARASLWGNERVQPCTVSPSNQGGPVPRNGAALHRQTVQPCTVKQCSPAPQTNKENQQREPTTATAPAVVAVAPDFLYPNTLQVLQGRFPAAEAEHAWGRECAASGFTDEEIAQKILDEGGPVLIALDAKTPVLVVRTAIGQLKVERREVQERQRQAAGDDSPNETIQELVITASEAPPEKRPERPEDRWRRAVLHHCDVGERHADCDGRWWIEFTDGERACAECWIGDLHRYNPGLCREYESRAKQLGGRGQLDVFAPLSTALTPSEHAGAAL